MHDPMTVAHEIYLGRKKKKNGRYGSPLITIWHVDPEKDGTDDSCGWFMRARHGDKDMRERIKKALDFEFDRVFVSDSGTTYHLGHFHPNTGRPNFSVHGIVLNMFTIAAWNFFNYNRRKHDRFMRKYLYDILQLAENTTDSMRDSIKGTFRGSEKWDREEALNGYTGTVYSWILRHTRPWYKHPRWHIHHWKIVFHPWQKFKRRYWDKCCVCGKRGFKGAAIGDWYGNKIWHSECDTSRVVPTPQK